MSIRLPTTQTLYQQDFYLWVNTTIEQIRQKHFELVDWEHLLEVPALPGCITEGDTRGEVMDNLQDAITGWLEVANDLSLETKKVGN